MGNFFKKIGKTIVDTGKNVGNGIVDGANAAWDGTQKGVICLNAINNVRGNVQGHDPRTWMADCAKQTLFKLQGPDYFKQCLENKIKQEIKAIKDPEKYVDSLWDEIKGGCS